HAIDAGYEGVKPGWARLSFHYLIDDDEMEFLIDAVAFVATHGVSFLPLYKFDWRSGAWRHRATESARDAVGHAAFDPGSWRAVDRSTTQRPADYAAYLSAALRLAAELEATAPTAGTAPVDELVPDEIDARLLKFAR
ncbi:MAG TPA: hypothetical protein VKZ43_01590, partial [Trueperaceae bacterium]|nr:hypothetical protein [Trueperaceae bacterium]